MNPDRVIFVTFYPKLDEVTLPVFALLTIFVVYLDCYNSKKKKKVAQKVEELDGKHFEIFRSMFEFIKSKSGIITR